MSQFGSLKASEADIEEGRNTQVRHARAGLDVNKWIMYSWAHVVRDSKQHFLKHKICSPHLDKHKSFWRLLYLPVRFKKKVFSCKEF